MLIAICKTVNPNESLASRIFPKMDGFSKITLDCLKCSSLTEICKVVWQYVNFGIIIAFSYTKYLVIKADPLYSELLRKETPFSSLVFTSNPYSIKYLNVGRLSLCSAYHAFSSSVICCPIFIPIIK